MSSHGWVGHSVTRVKCNEMRSLELFNAGGTADNTVYSPRDVYYILGLFCASSDENIRTSESALQARAGADGDIFEEHRDNAGTKFRRMSYEQSSDAGC